LNLLIANISSIVRTIIILFIYKFENTGKDKETERL